MRGARAAPHGDQIARALLIQLAAEGRDDAFIRDVIGFHQEIGLPFTLAALGMPAATAAEIAEIADWTMTAPHLRNLAVPVDAAGIAAATRRVEALA